MDLECSEGYSLVRQRGGDGKVCLKMQRDRSPKKRTGRVERRKVSASKLAAEAPARHKRKKVGRSRKRREEKSWASQAMVETRQSVGGRVRLPGVA